MILNISYLFNKLLTDDEISDPIIIYRAIELPNDTSLITDIINKFKEENPELQVFKYHCCNFEIKLKDDILFDDARLQFYIDKFCDFVELNYTNPETITKNVIFLGE